MCWDLTRSLQGWAPRICPPWDFWSADAVEGHVPRTLALGSIVPILDQERQGWGLFRGAARVGQSPAKEMSPKM
jgi:hypothetical protein